MYPQSTVLSPLLFSLYINSTSTDIESVIKLLADACVCYREIKVKEDTVKLQNDIDRLTARTRKWDTRKRGSSVVRHLPLVLEVPGLIPARVKENFGVRTRFL